MNGELVCPTVAAGTATEIVDEIYLPLLNRP